MPKLPRQTKSNLSRGRLPEKPLGLKIAVILYIIIGLAGLISTLLALQAVSAMPSQSYSLALEEAPSPTQLINGNGTTIGNGTLVASLNAVQNTAKNIALMFLAALTLINALFLVFAYFVWKRNKLARYAITAISIIYLLDFPVGTLFNLIALYLLWLDGGTKTAFAPAKQK